MERGERGRNSKKGNGGGGREEKREEVCPGFAFEIYGHLRGRAWKVFLVKSWRDVSVGMKFSRVDLGPRENAFPDPAVALSG